MGGQPVIRVLVKANDDVISVVIPSGGADGPLGPGLRLLARQEFGDGFDFEVTHEPCPGSGELASEFRADTTTLDSHSADVVLLSVMSDFPTPVESYLADMDEILRLLIERTEAHIIVFNASSVDPHHVTSNYHNLAEPPSLQVHRLNLALLKMSVTHGISIVDVDRVLAELGADGHVQRLGVYSPRACEALCRELLRIIADYGFFEHRTLVPQVGRRGAAS